ncbi:MAG: helix-turn-helix domain-containing protein, partial [Fusobacteriaceae bacterium]|nr:helix-turn-helix domain-containing protein [Fusobacteriaceae bacterium]
VFLLLIKGYTYREIAERLNKSLKTIDNTIQRIKRKSHEWYSYY